MPAALGVTGRVFAGCMTIVMTVLAASSETRIAQLRRAASRRSRAVIIGTQPWH